MDRVVKRIDVWGPGIFFVIFLVALVSFMQVPVDAYPTASDWELSYTGQNNWLKDVQFISPQVGYAVGESKIPLWYGPEAKYRGSILRTFDGGETWEEMYT